LRRRCERLSLGLERWRRGSEGPQSLRIPWGCRLTSVSRLCEFERRGAAASARMWAINPGGLTTVTDSPETSAQPTPPPPRMATASPQADTRSKLWAALPLIAALGFGASAFLPWIDADGKSVNAMDIRLDFIWADLIDFELDGAWLGFAILAIAGFGVVTILLRSVPAVFYRIVGIVGLAVVALFFWAMMSADGFEFIQYGAYAAAVFAVLMLIPRN